MRRRLSYAGLVAIVVLAAVSAVPGQSSSPGSSKHPQEYTFEVVAQYPHDPTAFTQGFTFYGGSFYEGTGRQGQSSLRQVEPKTGRILRKVALSPEFFGEGIAIVGNEVIQLTWLSHTGFVYDLKDFRELRTFKYPGEGWGLTTDGRDLFMSDGSAEIRVLDGSTFSEKRRIKVRDQGKPIDQLNEVEFVEGEIFANVWHSDRIARISPRTGEVLGWIDLTGLLGPFYQRQAEAVLNGIAYDRETKRLFVTGKLWPKIFEIRVVAKSSK
ncbi:MAG: glutaminyl-peptide cyclotransferase [Candidatus Sulfotelmatobacter sp.]